MPPDTAEQILTASRRRDINLTGVSVHRVSAGVMTWSAKLAEVIDAGADRAVQLPSQWWRSAGPGFNTGVPLATVMRTFRLSQDLLGVAVHALSPTGVGRRRPGGVLELVTSWLFSYVGSALVRSSSRSTNEEREPGCAAATPRDDVLAGRARRSTAHAATKSCADVNPRASPSASG